MKDVEITIIQNHDGPPGVKALIRKAVRAAFGSFGYAFPAKVDVLLCGDDEMRALNSAHRGVDDVTDVLSFPAQHACEGVFPGTLEWDPFDGRALLGDIAICLTRALEQAGQYGHGLDRECAYLAVHATLHLLGFDHLDEGQQKARMREKEEQILSKLSLGISSDPV